MHRYETNLVFLRLKFLYRIDSCIQKQNVCSKCRQIVQSTMRKSKKYGFDATGLRLKLLYRIDSCIQKQNVCSKCKQIVQSTMRKSKKVSV